MLGIGEHGVLEVPGQLASLAASFTERPLGWFDHPEVDALSLSLSLCILALLFRHHSPHHHIYTSVAGLSC